LTLEGQGSENLQKALEAKLKKVGGPAIRNKIQLQLNQKTSISTSSFEDVDSPMISKGGHSASSDNIIEIADKRRQTRQTGFLARFFKQPSKFKQLALFLVFLSLAAVFILVRKR